MKRIHITESQKDKIEKLKGMAVIPNEYFKSSKIKEINIPNNITSIGVGAFFGCTSLTSITIPNSITKIENYAFCGCSSLTSVRIPDSVTSIGMHAFSGCYGLTSITIPNSVISFGRWAFYGCTSLTSITIPNKVISIAPWAFESCRSLTSVTIPDSVDRIGERAFYYCNSLTSVTIPDRFKDRIGDIFGETNANFKFYGQQNESLIKKTRRIFITESQLKQTLKLKEDQNSTEIPVDADALGKLNPSKQTEVLNRMKSSPSTDYKIQVDVDKIQSPTEIKNITEDMNDGISVSEQVVDFIINNYKDIDCDSTIPEIKNAIQDAYIECFGEEMEYDNNSLYNEIINLLKNRLFSSVSESVIIFTKKQIKEAKKNKRIAESTILTKSDILKGLR